MTHPATKIANYFIKLSGYKVTPMKLIKLVYISHGWHLALANTPLIDEPIEAWRYGPVIRSLYQRFKHFGNLEITELVDCDNDNIEDDSLRLLKRIWDVYGKFTAVQLSNLTHRPETPWYKTWYNSGGKYHEDIEIDNDSVKTYYQNLADNRKN